MIITKSGIKFLSVYLKILNIFTEIEKIIINSIFQEF